MMRMLLKSVLLISLLNAGLAFAQNPQAARLNSIQSSIEEWKKDLKEKQLERKNIEDEEELAALDEEIDSLNETLADLEKSFDIAITGGIDLTPNRRKKSQKRKFDWQKDLLEIVEPILSELRKITAHRQMLDSLKEKIKFHRAQRDLCQKALKRLGLVSEDELSKAALVTFNQKRESWKYLFERHESDLDTAMLQLKEAQIEGEKVSFKDSLEAFMVGRGATLLIAALSAGGVVLWMKLLLGTTRYFLKKRGNRRVRRSQKVIGILFQILTVTLCVVAVLYVFHVRHDRVLQALGILLIVGTLFVAKNSIPKFVTELKLLLNLGVVREGHRVIYKGIPWKVKQIHLISTLENPCVLGRELKVPLRELLDLVSRPCHKNEKWFPCHVNDYLMLPGDEYVQVLQISPDFVSLRCFGGAEKTMMVSDFLSSGFQNISHGFGLVSYFGVDYKYQAEVTTKFEKILESEIRKQLDEQSYASDIGEFRVAFYYAGASSLDFKIVASFGGKAADQYYRIQRHLQKFAVNVCNNHDWEIPFQQVTVHTASE
jgi:small-conductance mechanosensitive channel